MLKFSTKDLVHMHVWKKDNVVMVDNFLIGFSKKLGLTSYRPSTFKSVQLYTKSDDILSTDTYLVWLIIVFPSM
jgi:hypothetical protein